MNKLLTPLIAALISGASWTALAGPDFQLIERAREAKRATLRSSDCDSMRLVLPLDHGPRPQTTPYQNERRKERFAAQLEACKAAAQKSALR